MKKYILIFMVSLLSIGCKGQENKTKKVEKGAHKTDVVEAPKGTWKVDKEFDKNGNLIRYDSLYSWSSKDEFDNLSLSDKDSLMQSFKSRFFSNYSGFENQGFDHVFSQDSLFSKHFFNDNFFGSNFGKDFMDIDKIRQKMIVKQKKFLEKYQSEFIEKKDEN
ncbi:hypothetical protein [Polaribacter sp. NJDZ03]|uniref:hypothetical protein n=1 Tax=Polaribacter sp. NJDZ03 TaxID=2855841 RepID=UPI001C4A5B5E|nr:hypothetical protein [Polaribacter sp. NJDZ03]